MCASSHMMVYTSCQVRTIICDDGRYHVRLQISGAPSYNAFMDRNLISDEAWDQLVKNMLRAEMMRRGMSYEQLVARLADLGVEENVLNLRNKVARGRFTASFFTQCMIAIGVNNLQIPSAAEAVGDATGDHGAQALAKTGSKRKGSDSQ